MSSSPVSHIGMDPAVGRDETVVIVRVRADEAWLGRARRELDEPIHQVLARVLDQVAELGTPRWVENDREKYRELADERRKEIDELRAQLADERALVKTLDRRLAEAFELSKLRNFESSPPKTSRRKLGTPVKDARKALDRVNEALISSGPVDSSFLRSDGTVDRDKLREHLRKREIANGHRALDLLKEARKLIDGLPPSRAKNKVRLEERYSSHEKTAKSYISGEYFDPFSRDHRPAPGGLGLGAVGDALAVLGFPKTLAEARTKYRELSKVAHPDRGGSHEAQSKLNRAWAVASVRLT